MAKRKVRITKRQLDLIRDEKKLRKTQKNTVTPGPWSELEPKAKVKARLKSNKSISPSLGEYSGVYRDAEGWKEKGTYPIVFNITASNLTKLVEKHGLDDVLAACEKSLNGIKDKSGKKIYGDLIILEILADHSKNPSRQFISCVGKTSKKRIIGFMAIRKGILAVIKDDAIRHG